MKLSDTQLMILSSASQRTDHAAVLPANLKGSAASKVVNKLLNEKLLQELRAKDDMPVWRRGDDNRPYSLRITNAGLKAIEVEDVAEASDNIAAADPDELAVPDMSTQAKSSERASRAKRSGAKRRRSKISRLSAWLRAFRSDANRLGAKRSLRRRAIRPRSIPMQSQPPLCPGKPSRASGGALPSGRAQRRPLPFPRGQPGHRPTDSSQAPNRTRSWPSFNAQRGRHWMPW